MTRITYDVSAVDLAHAHNGDLPWGAGEPRDLPPLAPEHARYRLYSVDDLAAFPPVEWLVPPYLAARELTGLYGKGDTYKSFIAIGWSAMLALRGHHVVYIAAEGAGGLRARIGAWMRHNGVASLPTLRFMPSNLNVHTRDIEAWGEAVGEQLGDQTPSLVVVDTLARNFVGGSENDAGDMGRFVEGADSIRRGFDTAVLVIHHTTKDGETDRGIDSFRNATFAMLRSDGQRLECDRMKDAQPPPPAAIRTALVQLPELGEGVSSLAVDVDATAAVAPVILSAPEQVAQRILAVWSAAGEQMSQKRTAERLDMRRDHDTFRKGYAKAFSTYREGEGR